MDAPNVYAVGTRVEVFPPHAPGQSAACPLLIEAAHPNATPIHVGLGAHQRIDLRVTFPGRQPLDLKNVPAAHRLRITPDGKLTELK
jgi:hypothetical protein